MAKNYGRKRTGRGAHSYMSKSRRSKRIVSATPVVSTIPRTLYPFVPAEMRLALRCTLATTYNVLAGGGQQLVDISLTSPALGVGTFPEYLEQFMAVYSRGRVDKVFVNIKAQNNSVNAVHWAFGVCSAGDGAFLAGADALQRIRMLPSSKFGMLGSMNGGNDQAKVNLFHDNLKAVGPGIYGSNYATTSTAQNPPVFTLPAVINVPDAPWGYFILQNPSGANSEIIVLREVVYHMTFSSKHAQAL